jgi:outer membrane protein TolC
MKRSKNFFITVAAIVLSLALSGPVFAEQDEPSATGLSEVEKTAHSIMTAVEPQDVGTEAESLSAEPVNTEPAKTLSLDECIDIAIKNSLPLKNVKKSMKLAEWRLFEARRNLLPKVGVRMEEHTGQIYGRRFYGKSTAVDLQQTAWHGGEYMYTMMQAQTNLKMVSREYARLKNDLVLQVKKAYYTLIKSKENLAFQDDLSRETAKIREAVDKQFESGVGTNLEFLNVSSQANQVKFQLMSAKGDLEIAGLILKQAMNVDIKETIDVEPLKEFKKVDVDFDKALKDALVYRPEMQIDSLKLQFSIYELRIKKAKAWPKIDFIGSFGMAKEEYISKDQGVDPASGTVDADQKMLQQWYAGIKCSVPMWGSTGEYSYTKEVWAPVVSAYRGTSTITNSYKINFLDNLAMYSERAEADAQLGEARQQLIKTKQDVSLEAKEACFNYEKALLQLDTAAAKVKYQQSDLELTKFRRQMDEVQDSNVIDSMIKLAQEKFGHVQAVSDCRTAIASIAKAVGKPDYFKDKEADNGNGNNK